MNAIEYRLVSLSGDASSIRALLTSCSRFLPIKSKKEVLFGAFDGIRLAGLALGRLHGENKRRILRSHVMVVSPEYQQKEIETGIKRLQCSWALDNGYRALVWAFDPFHSDLAEFYFQELGASADSFYDYLELDVGDRGVQGLECRNLLEIRWRTQSEKAKRQAVKNRNRSEKSAAVQPMLCVGDSDYPVVVHPMFNGTSAPYRLEVPPLLDNLCSALADEWRNVLDEILHQAFLRKYSVVDFVVDDGVCIYFIAPPVAWFLYVVECADQTLYTGITPDVERRLRQHNAGRGAVYTALRVPVRIVGLWQYPYQGAAIKAEMAFKRLTRMKKWNHINSGLDFEGVPFRSPYAF